MQLARRWVSATARWPVGNRQRTPELDNVAKTFFYLYAEGCFDDLDQAVDLAADGPDGRIPWQPRAAHLCRRDRCQDWRVPALVQPSRPLKGRKAIASIRPACRPTMCHRPGPPGQGGAACPRDYRLPCTRSPSCTAGRESARRRRRLLLRDEQLGQFFRDGTLFIPWPARRTGNKPCGALANRQGCPLASTRRWPTSGKSFNSGPPRRAVWRCWPGRPATSEDLAPLLDVGPQVRILITCQDGAPWPTPRRRWEPTSELVLWQAVRALRNRRG